MATKSQSSSFIHNPSGIDPIDAVVSPLFVASSLATTGIATISIMGYGFSDALYSASGTSITIGFLLGLVALAAAWGTNQVDFQEWNQTELMVVGGMLVAHLSVALVPIVHDTVTSNQVFAIPIVAVQAAGYYLIAYY